MKRLPGWRARLAAAMLDGAEKPFSWGDNDCLIGLVMPAIKAVTGVDLGADVRGKYHDAAGAKALAISLGFADLSAALGKYLTEIPVARAGIGDIALIPVDEAASGQFDLAMGVVIGDRIMVQSPKGRANIKLSRATRAFRVGE